MVYIAAFIGFASVIYLFIYAWRHPPEQEHSIGGNNFTIQIDLKELQQKYNVVIGEITNMKKKSEDQEQEIQSLEEKYNFLICYIVKAELDKRQEMQRSHRKKFIHHIAEYNGGYSCIRKS